MRWLRNALWVALVLGPVWAVSVPGIAGATGWPWGLLLLTGVSLIIGAMAVVLQRPMQRSCAAALAGLSGPQRQQAVRALRRGDIPADPAVLAGAIRVGALWTAYRRRSSGRQRVGQRVARWLVPAVAIGPAILGFATGDVRYGLTGAGLVAVLAALVARARYVERRVQGRLALLRSAAGSAPEAVPASTDDEDSIALPPRRLWLTMVAAAIAAVAAGAPAYMWSWPSPRPDCRTADAVMRFVAAHPDMLDAQLITPGDPGLNRYEDWSVQLQHYSGQVSAPDIAPHVRRIAELSNQAVSLVRDVRKDPLYSPTEDEIANWESAYQTTIGRLIAEDNSLNGICHPRK